MKRDAFTLPLAFPGELIIDNFAGGGGTSTGLEAAFGRPVDIAINHDPEALAMHAINHPHTLHLCESVWDVDPIAVTGNQPVGLVWLSPDCKHFSKAKGGTPVAKHIRGLAWVGMRWVAKCKPRVLMLENVEEFQTWGPLLVGADGTARPDPARKGKTFQSFVRQLRAHGYVVDWKELRACDNGAPTIRKRLFLIARRDGLPIVWPEQTHGEPTSAKVLAGKLLPYRTAAECIDFTLPAVSIFNRKKALATNTQRRVAKGLWRHVLTSASPFIVGVGGRMGQSPERNVHTPMQTITSKADSCIAQPVLTPYLTEHANASNQRTMAAQEPLRTQCAQVKGGHFSLVTPTMAPLVVTNTTGHTGAPADGQMPTIATGGHHTLAAAALIPVAHGERRAGESRTADLHHPIGTLHAGGGAFAMAGAQLINTTIPNTPENTPHGAVPTNHPGHGTTVPVREPVRHQHGAGGEAVRESGRPAATAQPVAHLDGLRRQGPAAAPARDRANPGPGTYGDCPGAVESAHQDLDARDPAAEAAGAFLITRGYGEREGQAPRTHTVQAPLGTAVASGVKQGVVAAHLTHLTHHGERSGHTPAEPLRTITGAHRGEQAMVAAHLVDMGHGEGQCGTKRFSHGVRDLRIPLGTCTASNPPSALVAACLEQANGGFYDGDDRPADAPASTITSSGAQQRLITAYAVKYYSSGGQWQGLAEPMHTLPTKGRMGLVEVVQVSVDCLAPEQRARARQCADLLHQHLPEHFPQPAELVLVAMQGQWWALVDITLRMLKPKELFKAQGFPEGYVINEIPNPALLFEDGKQAAHPLQVPRIPLSATAQVRMCGNSVSPPQAEALVRANFGHEAAWMVAA
jgi:DNA (cytosine-5)-methyltransferase 1